jgi:uncharacterized protein YjbI with pentapeptide repeats
MQHVLLRDADIRRRGALGGHRAARAARPRRVAVATLATLATLATRRSIVATRSNVGRVPPDATACGRGAGGRHVNVLLNQSIEELEQQRSDLQLLSQVRPAIHRAAGRAAASCAARARVATRCGWAGCKRCRSSLLPCHADAMPCHPMRCGAAVADEVRRARHARRPDEPIWCPATSPPPPTPHSPLPTPMRVPASHSGRALSRGVGLSAPPVVRATTTRRAACTRVHRGVSFVFCPSCGGGAAGALCVRCIGRGRRRRADVRVGGAGAARHVRAVGASPFLLRPFPQRPFPIRTFPLRPFPLRHVRAVGASSRPNRSDKQTPKRAAPRRDEPRRAATSRAELRAEPSRAEPSRAEPSRAEPSRAEPSRAEPGGWESPSERAHHAAAYRRAHYRADEGLERFSTGVRAAAPVRCARLGAAACGVSGGPACLRQVRLLLVCDPVGFKYEREYLREHAVPRIARHRSPRLVSPPASASARLGFARLRSARLRSARLGFARLRSARLRSASLGFARLRSASLGSASARLAPGFARLGFARLRSASLRSASLGSARLGSARLGSARLGSARLGSARLGSARLGSARLGSARPPLSA